MNVTPDILSHSQNDDPFDGGSSSTSLGGLDENASDFDRETIILSLKCEDDPRPVSLLRIPRQTIDLYSTKPRKWLLYVVTVICGVEGKLRYLNANEDIEDQEMEDMVNGGDSFIFHLSGEPNFLDWHLRDYGSSRSSVTSQSREMPSELKDYYGECPFTSVPIPFCRACHLIPFHKGDEYLRKVLRAWGDPDDEITIDSTRNMIVLNALLHTAFDKKTIGFLKTSNRFLKTNEIRGAESEDADSYRFTLHCFDDKDRMRRLFSHDSQSDLTEGSGLMEPALLEGHNPYDYRPKDILLDLTYVSGLLRQWSHEEGRKILEDYSNEFYGDIVKQWEDRQRREREARNKCGQEERNPEQDPGTVKRSGDSPAALDEFDYILLMTYFARKTSLKQIEAEIAQHRRAVKENKAECFDSWRKELHERRTLDFAEGLENPESSIPVLDDDDEKPVSIEDALNRHPPDYSVS
ncbi:hypothetical protein ACEPAI_2972 [Sanghuangporus weigelae]